MSMSATAEQAELEALKSDIADALRTIVEMSAELERMRGLRPELPPRPPDGTDRDGRLPRYGLRWNGPGQPVSVPMDDGYWTPWHIAQAELDAAQGEF